MAKQFTHVWEKQSDSGSRQRITVYRSGTFESWYEEPGPFSGKTWIQGDEPYKFELQEIILGKWTKLEDW